MQDGAVVKNPPAHAGDTRDTGSIPGSGRSLAGGNGNPLQYSCPENPMDKEAWRVTVHRAAKSQPQLSTHTHWHGQSPWKTAWWFPPKLKIELPYNVGIPLLGHIQS